MGRNVNFVVELLQLIMMEIKNIVLLLRIMLLLVVIVI